MILRIVKWLDGLRSDVFPKGMILRIVKHHCWGPPLPNPCGL